MTRQVSITAFLLFALASNVHAMGFYDALAEQESHNRPLSPHKDVNGEVVIGYFQISYAYWKDAYDFDNSIGGTWKDCEKNKAYGILVIKVYMARYCPKALVNNDYETMARCHNGGPNGAKIKSTVKYWKQIKALMNGK